MFKVLKMKNTLVKRLSVYFFLFAIIPAILMGAWNYYITQDAIVSNASTMMQTIIKQNATQVRLLLNEVDNTYIKVLSSQEIVKLLNTGYDEEGEALFHMNLGKLLESSKSSSDIKFVNWYPIDAHLYPDYANYALIPDYDNRPWYRDKDLRTGHPMWSLERIVPSGERVQAWILTKYQLFVDKDTFRPLGIVGVSIAVKTLTNYIYTPKDFEGQRFIVINKDGVILNDTHSPSETIGTYIGNQSIVDQTQSSYWTELDNRPVYITHHNIPPTTWNLISVIPGSSLLHSLDWVRNGIILLCVGYLIFGIALSIYMYNHFLLPILHLTTWMRKVEQGNLDSEERFPSGKGEISYLFYSFNKLVDRVKTQILEIYTTEQKKRELEFEALNYQIRPHFMYNTLDTIKWKAMNDRPEVVVDIIDAFSGLLRGTLVPSSFISIKDEIQQVKYYVELEKYRHKGGFDVIYDIDPQTLAVSLPRLFLQPLVENAIRHGVLAVDEKGIILVRIYHNEDVLYIEVIDNGPGFPKEFALIENDNKRQGIGLLNVYKRMELYLGVSFRMEWRNDEAEGTKISISIPMKELGDKISAIP